MDRAQLARMLQGGNVVGGQPSYPTVGQPPHQAPLIVRATGPNMVQNAMPPPPVGPQDFAPPRQTLPQMPTPNTTQAPPQMAQPAPGNSVQQNAPGVVPPMPPSQMIGAAPGMQDPSTLTALATLLKGGQGVDEWRRMMDQAQFARQGQ